MSDRVVSKIWEERQARKRAGAFTSIGEAWASYSRDVMPKNPSAVQLEECKRAFYAGAAGCFTAVLDAVGPEDEAACEQRLEALDRELQDFIVGFKKREGV